MGKLKMGLSNLSPEKLAQKAMNIETKMGGNPHFPEPVPDLASLAAARVELSEWTEKAQFGDRLAISTRRTKQKALADLIRSLAHYVSLTANGDEDIILSSGFEIRRKSEPIPPVGVPQALTAKRSTKSGVIELAWNAPVGSVSYVVEMTTQDPAATGSEFTYLGTAHRSKFTVTNLAPGTYYWFRVKAIGRGSESGFSDPAMIMAT